MTGWKNAKITKIKILKFNGPITNKEATANWSDLIAIYKIENNSLCKLTKPTHAKVHLNNFENQIVSLVLNNFNEKTAAFLDLKGCNDAWLKLNVKNKKPFESADDERLECILLLAE